MASGVINVGVGAVDLLWENSDITVAFVSQTLSMDLSEYSSVKIEFKSTKDYPERAPTMEVPVYNDRSSWSSNEVIRCASSTTYNGQAGGELLRRDVRPTVSGIYCSIGYRQLGTVESSSTAYFIPVRIYGVRGTPEDWK